MCRKCSLMATHRKLVREADKLSESQSESLSSSKKKRGRDARKYEARVRSALDAGRIEDDIKGVPLERVFSKCSTKQAMIARVSHGYISSCFVVLSSLQPPPILALHLNRSMYYGYAGKNPCRIVFPEILDLTPFTTSGNLSTSPSAPISNPPSIPLTRSTTPTPALLSVPRVLYRLAAVVSHYGTHSYGHYVTFRRKPRPVTTHHGIDRFAPPKLQCPLGCECTDCLILGPIRDILHSPTTPTPEIGGWLRISDDNVQEVSIGAVLAETAGTFMLYYERVVGCPAALAISRSRRSSEETIRPPVEELMMKKRLLGLGNGNGSGEGQAGPRLVRSVYARSKSQRRAISAPSSPKSLAAKLPVRSIEELLSPLDETEPSAIPLPSSPSNPNGVLTNGTAQITSSSPKKVSAPTLMTASLPALPSHHEAPSPTKRKSPKKARHVPKSPTREHIASVRTVDLRA